MEILVRIGPIMCTNEAQSLFLMFLLERLHQKLAKKAMWHMELYNGHGCLLRAPYFHVHQGLFIWTCCCIVFTHLKSTG